VIMIGGPCYGHRSDFYVFYCMSNMWLLSICERACVLGKKVGLKLQGDLCDVSWLQTFPFPYLFVDSGVFSVYICVYMKFTESKESNF